MSGKITRESSLSREKKIIADAFISGLPTRWFYVFQLPTRFFICHACDAARESRFSAQLAFVVMVYYAQNHLMILAGRVFPCQDGLKFRVFHSIQLFLLVGQKSYSWFVCVLRYIKGICSYTAEFCLAKIKFTFRKFFIKVQKTLNRWRKWLK